MVATHPVTEKRANIYNSEYRLYIYVYHDENLQNNASAYDTY